MKNLFLITTEFNLGRKACSIIKRVSFFLNWRDLIDTLHSQCCVTRCVMASLNSGVFPDIKFYPKETYLREEAWPKMEKCRFSSLGNFGLEEIGEKTCIREKKT